MIVKNAVYGPVSMWLCMSSVALKLPAALHILLFFYFSPLWTPLSNEGFQQNTFQERNLDFCKAISPNLEKIWAEASARR